VYDLMDHLRERWMAYAAILACSGPLLYIFRRQVIPVVWYAAEIAIYLGLFHLLTYGVVRVAAWFKYESTFMHEKLNPNWRTPLIAIWDREVYNPSWLFYFELAAAILILVGVFRYRPFRIQTVTHRTAPLRKGIAPQARPTLPSRSGVRK